jgi:hypothetical protein
MQAKPMPKYEKAKTISTIARQDYTNTNPPKGEKSSQDKATKNKTRVVPGSASFVSLKGHRLPCFLCLYASSLAFTKKDDTGVCNFGHWHGRKCPLELLLNPIFEVRVQIQEQNTKTKQSTLCSKLYVLYLPDQCKVQLCINL